MSREWERGREGGWVRWREGERVGGERGRGLEEGREWLSTCACIYVTSTEGASEVRLLFYKAQGCVEGVMIVVVVVDVVNVVVVVVVVDVVVDGVVVDTVVVGGVEAVVKVNCPSMVVPGPRPQPLKTSKERPSCRGGDNRGGGSNRGSDRGGSGSSSSCCVSSGSSCGSCCGVGGCQAEVGNHHVGLSLVL